MPLYEFRCSECGATCEVITPRPSVHAEFCVRDGQPMDRVYSPPVLKGETVSKS